MQLHQRGVDLLLNIMDAAQHAEEMKPSEIREILDEATEVLSAMLERDAEIALRNAKAAERQPEYHTLEFLRETVRNARKPRI